MNGFDVYTLRPRQVLACKYTGDNHGVLTQINLISKDANSTRLKFICENKETFVEVGEWIVKVEGSFYKYSEEEFQSAFAKQMAGISCIFCGFHAPNMNELKEHSATCEKHPAVIAKGASSAP